MDPYSYLWIFIICLIVAFADAFGIGANDVANSFSTSVGSRSLTLKQACCIAIFTEFGGAFLLGSATAETIRSNIVKLSLFQEKPEILMLAMTCALIGSSSWVIFATSRGWPVSTTHSIVGAIIGVGVSAFGWNAVLWGFNGVTKIIVAWLVSPIIAAIVASCIYLGTKYLVLVHQENSFQRGLMAIPVYFAFTVAINVAFLANKAPRLKEGLKEPWAFAVTVIVATIVFTAFSYFFYAVFLRRKIIVKETGLRWYHIFVIRFIGPRYDNTSDNTVEKGGENQEGNENEENKVQDDIAIQKQNIFQKGFEFIKKHATHGINKEIADYKADEHKEMHDAAIKYDPNTEELYSFLQVLTASFASFAHGSNDVANAVGPLAATFAIYQTGQIPGAKSEVPIWVLAFGGLAIDVGLIFYGYHVMRALGNRLTYHSPSRGFSMELGASLTVLSASQGGFPISTTHCITGATAGVGLCNGNAKALNWKLLAWCFFSWVLTLPVAALIAAGIFSFAINAPSLR